MTAGNPRDVPIEDTAPEDMASDSAEEVDESPETEAAAESVATETSDILEELQATHDRLLRLQAEFDNFRKREARERAAAWARAKADLSQKLISPLDDLRRVAGLDPDLTATPAVIEGLKLVQRKFLETLEREGLSTVGEVGETFDPHLHEAIGMWPAPSPEHAGTVAAVTAPGYKFGNQLLRPAQVQVYEQPS